MKMASLPAIASAPTMVQRTCAIGRVKTAAERQASPHVPPIVHDALQSPGQPLDATTRAFVEPRFGRDFSDVRIHSNDVAEQSAHEVDAHAFTVGKDFVFASGRFAPRTPESMHLLSHELAHVIQQSGDATTTLQRQPAAPGRTAETSEEKPGASQTAAKAGPEKEEEL